MHYITMPKTSLSSAAIAFGCDGIGTRIDEPTSFQMLDDYVTYGGNHIDTAHIYGGGDSETTVGRWLQQRGGRENLILATKGAHPDPSAMHIPRLSYDEILSDLNTSLRRLQCDYVDLYWLHRDCTDIPVDGIIDALNAFVKQGKIRFFGCSNWTADRIRQANEYAAKTGQTGFCASQIKWSLAATAPQYEDDPTLVEMTNAEYEFYKNANLTVVAFASQGKGFFSKMEQGGPDALSEKARLRYYFEDNVRRYEKAKALAEAKNASISALVLSYLYSQPFPVIPIVGCSNPDQLKDSMKYSDLVLTEEERNSLE